MREGDGREKKEKLRECVEYLGLGRQGFGNERVHSLHYAKMCKEKRKSVFSSHKACDRVCMCVCVCVCVFEEERLINLLGREE